MSRSNQRDREHRANGASPVLIIGMHRAGTSMLTRLLRDAGLYAGRRLTRNAESPFMNSLNYWLFEQASASWDVPWGVDALLGHDAVRPAVRDYLDGVCRGPAAARYLGAWRWLRTRALARQPWPWGWKDPRTTFTLPLWLELFPDARVVHITRHGVDVAESLRQRHRAAAGAAIERFRRRRRWYVNNPQAPKRRGLAHAPAVERLEYGLDLWHAYTLRARGHCMRLGPRALQLRYEDLLAAPREHLPAVLDFCGLSAPAARLDTLAESVYKGRRYAFASDAGLRRFADEHEATLRAAGYGARPD